MIAVNGVTKLFGDFKAVDNISITINKGSIFGLVGTNGAGKSTLIRMLTGVYKTDGGKITIDGEDVFENIKIKGRIFYISDDQYFLPNAKPRELAKYYAGIYQKFDMSMFENLMNGFDLPMDRKINSFSKGMKKQLSVICGISANTDYIFCDETFDGLDPVMRQAVKSLFAEAVAERGLTPIIASHNLRELEDICDHVGLLHKGGMLLAKDLDDLKLGASKVQLILPEGVKLEEIGLEIVSKENRGALYTILARGSQEKVMELIDKANPVFAEVIPLTLEEYFIMETEVAGYDIKKLFI